MEDWGFAMLQVTHPKYSSPLQGGAGFFTSIPVVPSVFGRKSGRCDQAIYLSASSSPLVDQVMVLDLI